ncbi:MAG TPA: hypothetical protein VF342_05010 [Alphaproteobacteria bacterium]
MITAREISFSLFGAWRLAHLDRSGMQYFDISIAGFWRSFWAAVVVLPAYLILVILRVAERPIAAGPARIAAIELIGYVIGWTAFPLASWYVVSALGRAERYLGYIVAYNWANVLQVCLYVPVAVVGGSGLLPDAIAMLLGVAAIAAVLYYQYFIARTALDLDAVPAIGLVLMDMILGVLISSTVDALEMR